MTSIINQRYQLLEGLGAGSFGEVFKGYDKEKNETVVIKRISKENVSHDKILEEVHALSTAQVACETSKILCFNNFKEDSQYFYIITEYLGNYKSGYDYYLSVIHDNTQLKDSQMITMLSNLITGLSNIHTLGIAHRDVKPANIMYNIDNMDIKYIDFGESCIDKTCVQEKYPVGTSAYAAPEIFIKKVEPTNLSQWQKADYWSLGLTIVDLIGSKPNPKDPSKPLYFINIIANKFKNDTEKMYTSLTTGNEGKGVDIPMNMILYYIGPVSFELGEFIDDHVLPLLRGNPSQRRLVSN